MPTSMVTDSVVVMLLMTRSGEYVVRTDFIAERATDTNSAVVVLCFLSVYTCVVVGMSTGHSIIVPAVEMVCMTTRPMSVVKVLSMTSQMDLVSAGVHPTIRRQNCVAWAWSTPTYHQGQGATRRESMTLIQRYGVKELSTI